jgi:hypothetical protein
MSTRLARMIEFVIGCGLLLSALLALRVHRVSAAADTSAIRPDNVAAGCQERQAQTRALLGH